MNIPIPLKIPLPQLHYPTRLARRADLIVHLTGLALSLFGGGLALGFGVMKGYVGLVAALGIYAAGLVVMLGLSTAYNFAPEKWQPLMRRFDHAGIFFMIAASYTPFTTFALDGWWAIGMTLSVWLLAGLGIVGKLWLPGVGKKVWVCLYIILGWLVIIALKPMSEAMPIAALILLGVGGLVYSIGVIFYMKKSLTYRRAIWHGHVLAGAGIHYAAVLVGVIFSGAAA